MKWINGETYQSKCERRMKWHYWYAWRPVTVDHIIIDGKNRKVKIWREYVVRRDTYHDHDCGPEDGYWTSEYKEITREVEDGKIDKR